MKIIVCGRFSQTRSHNYGMYVDSLVGGNFSELVNLHCIFQQERERISPWVLVSYAIR